MALTLLFGLAPALPLIVIRPLLPESTVWRRRKADGSLKRPRIGALFDAVHRRTTIVATLLTACSYAATYGAIQQIPRIVPGLLQVRRLAPIAQEQTISAVHLFSDLGNNAGASCSPSWSSALSATGGCCDGSSSRR
jgi:hypothetical protein